jgi:hypothetical protein
MRQAGGDVTKLPKWAQMHIEVLQADVEYRDRQLGEMASPDAKVQLVQGMNENRGLPDEARVRFRLGDKRITVHISRYDNVLDINSADGALQVEPSASNHIYVRVKDR